ncbi:MAG: LysR family transcriptional regulator [Rhodobacteraceae bacterium]|nr:LysR family transcriptional regulator [Paracoccaceae bacterium]
MNLRQLHSFVGIVEEGSFNRAAQRLNATQSGLSMQIRNLEEDLQVSLLDRTPRGVTLTRAGRLFYGRAVAILRQVNQAEAELKDLSGKVSGPLKVGLMPTFTRGLLAPVLDRFIAEFPNVELTVVEAYSAVLTQMVQDGQSDFAIVPQAPAPSGLTATYLGTDREILVGRPGGPRQHLAPVRLADLQPLKLALPAPGNARRDAINAFLAGANLEVATIVDMDAMIATLEFVRSTDFVTILPATMCTRDIDAQTICLNPLIGPAMTVSYAIVEPATRALPAAAEPFLERLRAEYELSQQRWQSVLEPA